MNKKAKIKRLVKFYKDLRMIDCACSRLAYLECNCEELRNKGGYCDTDCIYWKEYNMRLGSFDLL